MGQNLYSVSMEEREKGSRAGKQQYLSEVEKELHMSVCHGNRV
jgi:hypothetical protein